MAMANGFNISTSIYATTLGHKVVESVQTVVPHKPTDPRVTRPVSVAENLVLSVFRRRVHIVLYYKKVSEEDSGWLVAGWIKASLGKALTEYPILAGRLQRGGKDDRELVIVSNDSGVRIFETLIDVNLDEYLQLEEREKGEAQLVFWEDIDELNPQFSPLVYVQVTNFKCGGYSIGFSSSILLADPLTMTSFLKRWANIHSNMVSKTEIPKLPLFYFPNLRKKGTSPNYPNGTILGQNSAQSLIFKAASEDTKLEYEILQKTVAVLCVEEARRILGRKIPKAFSFYVKQGSEEVKVEKLSKEVNVKNPRGIGVNCASWDELGGYEISLQEGNKPAGVSYWLNSEPDEGLVMVIMSPDEGISGMRIVVTVPSEKGKVM